MSLIGKRLAGHTRFIKTAWKPTSTIIQPFYLLSFFAEYITSTPGHTLNIFSMVSTTDGVIQNNITTRFKCDKLGGCLQGHKGTEGSCGGWLSDINHFKKRNCIPPTPLPSLASPISTRLSTCSPTSNLSDSRRIF
jgi:hypothetical protein